jgi:hypothetical protein
MSNILTDEEVEEIRKLIKYELTEEQFEHAKSLTDMNCRKCGQCCIKYEIPKLGKKAGEPCKYLVDNLCSIHEDKPDFCKKFPYIGDLEHASYHSYVLVRRVFCPIIEDLFLNIQLFYGRGSDR